MYNWLKHRFRLLASLLLIAQAAPSLANTPTIDVLVVYTKGVEVAYGEATTSKINQLFEFTNQIYRDSEVNVAIRLAGTLMVDYTDENDGETALRDITFARVDAFKPVEALRQQLQADMVILYRPYKKVQGNCGQAWIGGVGSEGQLPRENYAAYMYSHIPMNTCGDYATAHELGHNMGLRHSRVQDGTGGTFPYALGHGVIGEFATIMAYQSSFNVDYWAGKVYKFSNPDLICKGQPCGVARDDQNKGADAAYALNITTPQIATYYQSANSQASSESQTSSSGNSNTQQPGIIPGDSTGSSSSRANSTASASSSPSTPVSNSGGGGGGQVPYYLLLLLFLLLAQQQYRRNALRAA